MASLLRRVKTTIAIHAHRKVRGMLEGEYTSVVHGRSMEFDDLRPYVAGDEVKDIDWKATAKLGTPMTKRFIASRKHTLLLVVDTGRSMAALAEGGEQKRDLAVLAAGTAGYIASRHGDRVALVSGDSVHSGTVQPGSTEAHLERILQRIHSTTTLGSAPSSLLAQLRFAAKAFHRRMIVLVIADDRELGEEEQHVLRRLSVQHEVLWFTIADADLVHADWAASSMHDVEEAVDLPAFLRRDPRLRAAFASSVLERTTRSTDLFEGLAISSYRVGASSDVVTGLLRLFTAHRHARR